uniref:Ig-like domain-containing protein n=1 Tax=Oryzias sinensis TaxID=183150 RepID=A0A8C8DL68_9TELE
FLKQSTFMQTVRKYFNAYSLRITPPEMVVRYGDSVVLECSVDDPEVILVSWETDYGSRKEINTSTSTLTIKKVESWILQPICFAVSASGSQCPWEPVITVYKTPDSVSVTAVDPGPMIEGKEYQLRCNIQSVAPVNKLRVKWYRGDECLHTDPKNSSLLTPQNETSFWTLPLERGDNGSTFRCEAELQLGPELSPNTSSAPYTVLVHCKKNTQTLTLHGNTSEEIIPGQNMTLDCSAEGNPEPETHWNYTSAENLHMATVGRHKIMTITRATSTNAGHYICVASNKLGRVTRSVLLIEMGMYGDCLRGKHFGWLQSGLQMKNTIFHVGYFVYLTGKTSDGPLSGSVLWITIICSIFLPLLLSLVVLFFYNKRKRGRYNVVNNHDPSQNPMVNIHNAVTSVKSTNLCCVDPHVFCVFKLNFYCISWKISSFILFCCYNIYPVRAISSVTQFKETYYIIIHVTINTTSLQDGERGIDFPIFVDSPHLF